MTTSTVFTNAKERCGFVNDAEVAVLASNPATRFQALLVRCGNGRFIVTAQDCKWFIDIIESTGKDYVRDVSLYSSN